MMEVLPPDEWEAGMSMSFLGRDICRPKPECEICLMKDVCAYYNGWKVPENKIPTPSLIVFPLCHPVYGNKLVVLDILYHYSQAIILTKSFSPK